MSNPFVPNHQNIINSKLLELGTEHVNIMVTTPCVSYDTYHMSCFTWQISYVICHISGVRCQVSGVTCQVSYVICNSQTVRARELGSWKCSSLYYVMNDFKQQFPCLRGQGEVPRGSKKNASGVKEKCLSWIIHNQRKHFSLTHNALFLDPWHTSHWPPTNFFWTPDALLLDLEGFFFREKRQKVVWIIWNTVLSNIYTLL